MFVSYNTNTGRELNISAFLSQFLDHYYPVDPVEIGERVPFPDARAQAARVAGEYAFLRRSYTTFQKVNGLDGPVTITDVGDGTLRMDSRFGVSELVPIGPLLYRVADGEERVAFREDGDSRVTHAFMSLVPVMALDRVPWFESPALHEYLLGFAGLLFAFTLLGAGGRAWRRGFGTPRPEDPLHGRMLLHGVALCHLGFAVAIGVLASSPSAMLTSPMTGLRIALALPIAGGVLAFGAAIAAVAQWRRGDGTRGARLRYGATVVAAFLVLWSLDVWNLLGWRL